MDGQLGLAPREGGRSSCGSWPRACRNPTARPRGTT